MICRREYHSNIMGRHSYVDVTLHGEPLHSHRESPDLLVTFEPEALCRHLHSLVPSGHLVCAEGDDDVELAGLGYLDARLRVHLEGLLAEQALPATVSGMLELARRKEIRVHRVPYVQLLDELAGTLGMRPRQVQAAVNTMAVSVSAVLLGIPLEQLLQAVERTFAGRETLIRMNRQATRIAYRYAQGHAGRVFPALPRRAKPGARLLLNGTQSTALGKLNAGMGFQTYYPISPATDESTFLEGHNRIPLADGSRAGPLLLQVEDELSAITMACGAALTGARSATSTSGPGFSLMTEGLGWAGMNEVPVVVTLYQRGGPSTGLPTRTDQGDLQTAIHGGHGEFPRVVIASGTVEECFHDAGLAFNCAESYQLPVVHLLDKALTSTLQTVPRFDAGALRVERGETFEPPAGGAIAAVPRFRLTESGISPRPLLGQEGIHFWSTGVEHSEEGQVSEDPVVRERMMEKRARKLEQLLRLLPREEQFRVHGETDAAFTLVTWGSTTGAVLDAMQRLAAAGIPARTVQLRLLWPFPAQALEGILENASPLVVVECNYSGQLDALLREQTGRGCDHLVVKYSGRPISGEALFPVLQRIHAGAAGRRTVLRNPYE